MQQPKAATSTPALTPSANPGAESGVVAPTATGRPVFGATMESTSQSGAGPAVPIGNSSVAASEALAHQILAYLKIERPAAAAER